MSPPKSSSETNRNPGYLRLAYLSFFLVQSFDCLLFVTLSPQLFTDPSSLTGPTQFFIRANAATLFPFVLLVFLFRKYHISSEPGRRVAWAFTLFHGLVLALLSWTKITGQWHLEPFWLSVAFHATWFACGCAALAKTSLRG